MDILTHRISDLFDIPQTQAAAMLEKYVLNGKIGELLIILQAKGEL